MFSSPDSLLESLLWAWHLRYGSDEWVSEQMPDIGTSAHLVACGATGGDGALLALSPQSSHAPHLFLKYDALPSSLALESSALTFKMSCTEGAPARS